MPLKRSGIYICLGAHMCKCRERRYEQFSCIVQPFANDWGKFFRIVCVSYDNHFPSPFVILHLRLCQFLCFCFCFCFLMIEQWVSWLWVSIGILLWPMFCQAIWKNWIEDRRLLWSWVAQWVEHSSNTTRAKAWNSFPLGSPIQNIYELMVT